MPERLFKRRRKLGKDNLGSWGHCLCGLPVSLSVCFETCKLRYKRKRGNYFGKEDELESNCLSAFAVVFIFDRNGLLKAGITAGNVFV